MKSKTLENKKFNDQILKANCQRGVSLIITFLIMTVIIAIVLSISSILFNEIKIIGDIGNSVLAFHAADTGIEKTLYFDRKQIPVGGSRGFCNTCTACVNTTNDCNNCTLTGSNCGLTTCTNCQLTYNAAFLGKTYSVSATVSPNIANPLLSDLIINSTGLYKGVTRQVNYSNTK